MTSVLASATRAALHPFRRRRLVEAERRFFDDYGRGGARQGRELVIPLDYFTRREVVAALDAGDAQALEREWRRASPQGDAHVFRENLRHFEDVWRRA